MSFPMVALGEVLTPISRPESVNPEKEYRILGAHWYAEGLYIKDIKLGSEIQSNKVYRIEKGDFVYNRLFAWKGSFAVATDENHGCYVSNEFPYFKVDSDRADSKYIWLYFSRAPIWEEALGLSTGGTPTSRNRLKEEKFLAMQISLPPLAEQRRIVARIEELAAKIEEARGLRKKAGEEVDIFLKSALKKIFTNLSQIHQNMTLKELGVFLSGGTPSKFIPAYWEGNIPFVTGADITDFWVRRSRTFLSDEGLHSGKTAICNKGTVLVVSRTRVGRVGIADVLMGASQDITPFICDKLILPEYATWNLMSNSEKLLENTRGTTIKGILRDYLEGLKVPIPPLPEQRRIVAYLDALQAKVDALRRLQAETGAELDALLPAVLDRAFKGEL